MEVLSNQGRDRSLFGATVELIRSACRDDLVECPAQEFVSGLDVIQSREAINLFLELQPSLRLQNPLQSRVDVLDKLPGRRLSRS